MRLRHLGMLAVSALLWAVGCNGDLPGDESGVTPPAGETNGVTRFAATIDSPAVTRAALDGKNAPVWASSDNLLVLTYNGSAVKSQFKASVDASSVNGATAYFNAPSGRSVPKESESYAIYPYFQPKAADVSGGNAGARQIRTTVSAQKPNFDGKLSLPLLAGEWNSASESFEMNNPLHIVKLVLSMPSGSATLNMQKIVVEGNNGEKLWGSTVTINTSDMSAAFKAADATSSLTMDCQGQTIGASGKNVYFAIPAQKYSKGLKLKLYCLEGYFETDIKASGFTAALDTIWEVPISVELKKSDIFIDTVYTTDTTVVVAWTSVEENVKYLSEIYPNRSAKYTEDVKKKYKVAIYSDEACSKLVYSVDNVDGQGLVDSKTLFLETDCPPRFVFAGLKPATDYYVMIYNQTDSKQMLVPFKVTTASKAVGSVATSNAKVGDVVLFENFGKLIYGGDLAARAAGVSRDDRGTLTSYEGVDLSGEITLDFAAASTSGDSAAYTPAIAGTEIGLFNTLKGLLDDMGIDAWGWIGGKSNANGGSVCARPGYLKIGTSGNRTFVVTPKLSAIPDGKSATVTVKFKAAPYGGASSEIDPEEKSVAVKVLDTTTLGSDWKVTYDSEGDAQIFTLDGNQSSDWKEYSVTLKGVKSTSRIAIGGGRESATQTNRFFLDDVSVKIDAMEDILVKGTIKYSDGTPAAGVVVSDGFSVAQTDAKGQYSLSPCADTWYIYYSVPEDCEVELNSNGQPLFYTKFNPKVDTYNFTLKKMAAKESKFTLFCLADPQCKSDSQEKDSFGRKNGDRFKNESVPAIKAHAQTKGVPCYGVTLGDIVYSEGSRNTQSFMTSMRDYMAASKIGMPVFQTMGNHDYTFFSSSKAINADATSSTYNMKAQRAFEDVFGPINYSWNRGDVHIVCMRNMQWDSNTDASKYTSPIFTYDQYKWLQQDLKYVPANKMVILCVHVPLLNSSNAYVKEVIALLTKFAKAHIMSGHTHYMRNEPTKSSNVYEHVHAAVSGQWWWSNMNGDGCPNGYGVYDIEGNNITNWYYMGINEDMNDRDFQIRIYRGDLKCGNVEKSKTFNMQHGNGVILANVFNADSSWRVEIFEDGVSAGLMQAMTARKYSPTSDTYPIGTSYPVKPAIDSSQDWWSIAYHISIIGRSATSGSYHTACYHMYKHTLKNPNAKSIRVEATDRFGRKYTCSEVIENCTTNKKLYPYEYWQ